MIYETPDIDVPRLFADLDISAETLDQLATIAIPDKVWVASKSPIKLATVRDALSIVQPNREFTVQGIAARSDVAEQPLGQTTIEGALNRVRSGRRLAALTMNETPMSCAWVAVENGLFRVGAAEPVLPPTSYPKDSVMLDTEEINLSPYYAPNVDYTDRAVAAVQLPGRPTAVQVSPNSEAVTMPGQAIRAAYLAKGGLAQNTAGSQLEAMGLVRDAQNPHSELSMNRHGGPLTRQDQIARVIVRAFMQLA